MKVTYSHGPQQGETVTVPTWRGRELIQQGAAVAAVNAPEVEDAPSSEKPKTNKKES